MRPQGTIRRKGKFERNNVCNKILISLFLVPIYHVIAALKHVTACHWVHLSRDYLHTGFSDVISAHIHILFCNLSFVVLTFSTWKLFVSQNFVCLKKKLESMIIWNNILCASICKLKIGLKLLFSLCCWFYIICQSLVYKLSFYTKVMQLVDILSQGQMA